MKPMQEPDYKSGNLAMRKYVAELEAENKRLKEDITVLEAERARLQEENKQLIEQLNYYAPPMPHTKDVSHVDRENYERAQKALNKADTK